jgi:hypothetical protein
MALIMYPAGFSPHLSAHAQKAYLQKAWGAPVWRSLCDPPQGSQKSFSIPLQGAKVIRRGLNSCLVSNILCAPRTTCFDVR